jgi:carbon starvation protein CstA
MLLFFASVAFLIIGYFFYGRIIDKLFAADPARPTPAVTMEDGVDYINCRPGRSF